MNSVGINYFVFSCSVSTVRQTDGQSSAYASGEKCVQNFRWRYRHTWEDYIKVDVIGMVG